MCLQTFQAPFLQASPLSSAYIPWKKHTRSDPASPPKGQSLSRQSKYTSPSFPNISRYSKFRLLSHLPLLRTLPRRRPLPPPSPLPVQTPETYTHIGIAQFVRENISRIKDRKVPEPVPLKEGEKLSRTNWA